MLDLSLILENAKLLTFGTTSLNHGFGDSNSANHPAVVEPTSLDRECISHSAAVRNRPQDEAVRHTLKVNTSIWMIPRQILEWSPGVFIPFCRLSTAA